ncbi:MAG: glycosyltransferase [Terriglobales bacterium]
MKVLLVHNSYQQRGGEETAVDSELSLLRGRGNQAELLQVSNDRIRGTRRVLASGLRAVYSRPSVRTVAAAVEDFRPDVVHVHNFFPLLSPSIYYAARRRGAAVVQTLHNYRLLCPNGLFFRQGRSCESCAGRIFAWPGVARGCYRGSRVATAAAAAMVSVHSVVGTWTRAVDAYIALTRFAKDKFVECGFPEKQITVKPNFVDPDPGAGDGAGGYALYVGRLSQEKGIGVMLRAWNRLVGKLPLYIVGSGPLEGLVREQVGTIPGLSYLGRKPRADVLDIMGNAAVLIFPSECYEGMPTSIAEALAKGTPVIAAKLGAMSTLVEHGRTGLHFRPGDEFDLVAKVEWALSRRSELQRMRRHARAEYEAKYTAEKNYQLLMGIYERAIAQRPAGEMMATRATSLRLT